MTLPARWLAVRATGQAAGRVSMTACWWSRTRACWCSSFCSVPGFRATSSTGSSRASASRARMLQGCPNGARQHGVPCTAQQVAEAAVQMVAAGVDELHIHPEGRERRRLPSIPRTSTSSWRPCASAVPGIPIGVTTGAWAEPDPARRVALIRAWEPSAAPDYASVNWHEDGALEAARALAGRRYRGRGGPVLRYLRRRHAGAERARQAHAPAARRGGGRPIRCSPPASRVTTSTGLRPLAEASGRPVLLHGQELGAWPVLRLAHQLGADQRIGREDVFVDSEGRSATNAALVRSARDILRR